MNTVQLSGLVALNDGGIAQLGERLLCTQEVRSSILLVSRVSKKELTRRECTLKIA